MDIQKDKKEKFYKAFSIYGLAVFAFLQTSNTNASPNYTDDDLWIDLPENRTIKAVKVNRKAAECISGCGGCEIEANGPGGFGGKAKIGEFTAGFKSEKTKYKK